MNNGGIGFFGILTIVFIVLKLIDKIAWSWVWVLSPMWLPFAAVLLFMGFALVMALVTGQLKHKNTVRRRW